MKLWTLVPFAVLVVGCSGGSKDASVPDAGNPAPKVEKPKTDEAKADSGGPVEAEMFGDDVFKIPAYPGSKHMPYTGIEMDTDLGHTYARHFSTPDDLDKVEAFIKTEGEKLGKYSNPMKGVFNEKLLRNGNFDLSDGSRLIFKLTKDEKGNKTDIMYNISVPKKK